jgi:hypothetical protein
MLGGTSKPANTRMPHADLTDGAFQTMTRAHT